MKRTSLILSVGLLIPLSIAIVGYSLEPGATALETIVLGAILLGSSLFIAFFLTTKSGRNP